MGTSRRHTCTTDPYGSDVDDDPRPSGPTLRGDLLQPAVPTRRVDRDRECVRLWTRTQAMAWVLRRWDARGVPQPASWGHALAGDAERDRDVDMRDLLLEEVLDQDE